MIRNSANLAAQAPRPAPPAPAASKPPVAEIGAIPVITPDPAPRPPCIDTLDIPILTQLHDDRG
ncbi:MAG: hypothetical protein WDA10_14925 [Porticoccaceae bacterium]